MNLETLNNPEVVALINLLTALIAATAIKHLRSRQKTKRTKSMSLTSKGRGSKKKVRK